MEFLLAVSLFVLPATVTPGPNNIMILTSGLNHGIKKTLPHFFGIITGFPAMVIAIGLGLNHVFTEYPILHQIIKYVGFSYLCFLAYKIARSNTEVESGKQAPPFTYLQAVLFQWVNPKAWVMAVTSVSMFTTGDGSFIAQVVKIALTFLFFGGPCVAVWLISGASLKRFFKSPKQLTVFNYSMAIFLVGSLVPVFF